MICGKPSFPIELGLRLEYNAVRMTIALLDEAAPSTLTSALRQAKAEAKVEAEAEHKAKVKVMEGR